MPKKSMDILTETMFYVLMTFLKGEMCGIDVADFIEKHTHSRLRLGPATLYTILGKFLKEGYIIQTELEGRKRTYRITENGKAAYNAELARLRQCVADADVLADDSMN